MLSSIPLALGILGHLRVLSLGHNALEASVFRLPQAPPFILSPACHSYCCACSVIDALARKTPARVMWPLVKDFISSKVTVAHRKQFQFFFEPFSAF
jgi:hypothetical protein